MQDLAKHYRQHPCILVVGHSWHLPWYLFLHFIHTATKSINDFRIISSRQTVPSHVCSLDEKS
jgi:hypothetical protein